MNRSSSGLNFDKTRLQLILGPMSSGKTTELKRRLQVASVYRTVLAVNTKKDTRYGSEGIITHDQQVYPALRISSVEELRSNPQYQAAQVVGIDEANFFKGLKEFILEEINNTTKSFIICGLNGDRDMNLFGSIHEFVSHADTIDLYQAICIECADGTLAPFTINIVALEGQENVGGTDKYVSVCRQHHREISKRNAKSP